MNPTPDAVIIGAGLAGLACAREFALAGVSFAILESSDAVGGRVRTDRVEGFRLDRGLQNYLSSYPEGKRVLDLDTLKLRPFARALLVRYRGKFHRIANPKDEFWTAAKSAFNPLGSIWDKLRAAKLNRIVNQGTLSDQTSTPDQTAVEFLRGLGLGDQMMETVFKPFLSSVFLESKLNTSARYLRFVYRNFGMGTATLPAEGMQAIPKQLATKLPPGSLRLNCPVAAITDNTVALKTGETLRPRAVIVATDGPAASRLTGGAVPTPGSNGTVTVYFAANESPLKQPVLALDGDGTGPATSLVVLSDVAPEYAPPGQSLIAASVVGIPADGDETVADQVQKQLAGWFGAIVNDWRLLKVHRIAHALPAQPAGWLEPWQRPSMIRPGLFVCGDHRDNASIDGALTSGSRTAQVAQDYLGQTVR